MVSKRRVLREMVVKLFFQREFRHNEFEEIFSETLNKIRDNTIKADFKRYVEGVFHNLSTIDNIISNHLINWSFDRLSYLERNVLRVGTYELIYEENIPIEVTINEMIEIAKKYGSEESGKFVNGILDRIAKEHAPKEKFNL
ncbi:MULTISPECIES: transcription antitermination factor NusB [Fervidobacterium]|uniref:Transcription antitermination protein NusB n=1 Tax=Fervidobacterium nodosum (strain ATCC 35602 / DSM 5306 / Rt17-B1) TaxID=381764 RepID=NUSB_FERNB|nr:MULTISPECIES: transcription antitermination factor NusB [Fervidobacterium]A7HJ80.1 RecName: Full=Transcription antitermination protein NusB; AltName: Full=Antitermination factor NusB [Fervidobacterium nodosum Rt17-B1]PHJ13821.1 antitermination protein NusB [Fervidobacterium sp. SC_NGM5_G05]HOJ94374.1 transcription antitermination factor NusB [Fervidobacterium nodosum]ABS59963.1 NusB antitermination factor [Fervidobacterium nodosum Rt17-B1]KAF2961673.1 N utilization substance protein B [Ferv